MHITLHIWRQKNAETTGDFGIYERDNVSEDMSFLEMLDDLNEHLSLLSDGEVLFVEGATETAPHGLIHTAGGSILLRIGDNVTTDPNARILASENIDIYGDFARTSGPVDVAGPRCRVRARDGSLLGVDRAELP